jgi:hypothetical protein
MPGVQSDQEQQSLAHHVSPLKAWYSGISAALPSVAYLIPETCQQPCKSFVLVDRMGENQHLSFRVHDAPNRFLKSLKIALTAAGA